MRVNIRQSKDSEWKLIQKLNNFVFIADKDNDDLDLNWPFSDKGIKYYKDLASGKWGHCLIAFAGKEAVGYVALAEKDFYGYRKSKYIEIENIGVKTQYRSQGVGKKLMDAAIKWAKKVKASKLYVSAYWGNKKAINFYKKNGFYEIGLELDKKLN